MEVNLFAVLDCSNSQELWMIPKQCVYLAQLAEGYKNSAQTALAIYLYLQVSYIKKVPILGYEFIFQKSFILFFPSHYFTR